MGPNTFHICTQNTLTIHCTQGPNQTHARTRGVQTHNTHELRGCHGGLTTHAVNRTRARTMWVIATPRLLQLIYIDIYLYSGRRYALRRPRSAVGNPFEQTAGDRLSEPASETRILRPHTLYDPHDYDDDARHTQQQVVVKCGLGRSRARHICLYIVRRGVARFAGHEERVTAIAKW